MKIALVYIYPLDGVGCHGPKAMRFIDSYHRHPPGMEHSTVIICNGGSTGDYTKFVFSSLLNTTLLHHDDSGMDIGGFLKAARHTDADLMIFCGGNSYFRRPGWMGRIRDSFIKHGDTLFGSSGNQGIGHIQPHIRTTGFWCSPALLRAYPKQVIQNHDRYEFEHGNTCLSNFVKQQGRTPYVVTWQGEHPLHQCDSAQGGYHHGSQEHLLIGDRMTEPPFHHCP